MVYTIYYILRYLFVNLLTLDGGDKSENRLRRMRKKGEKIGGRHEGSYTGRIGTEAEQADSDWVRGPQKGIGTCQTSNGEEGRVLALCALRCCPTSLRTRGV